MDILEHLKERHVQLNRYLNVSWDDETVCFPLWNLSGQMVGYQQYRPGASKEKHNDPREGRYFTYRTRIDGHPHNRETRNIAVFGLETISPRYRPGILFITEGIFDAVRVHNLNLSCVASLSNDPKDILSWIRTLSQYRVAVMDSDPAGKKLAKCGHVSIVCTGSKDLGDMTDTEVKELLKDYLNEDQ